MDNNSQKTNEVSIFDFIERVWRGKWIVIVITVVCVVCAFAYSFFMVKDQYSAGSMIKYEDIEEIGLSGADFINEVTNQQIVSATLETLNARGSLSSIYSEGQIASMVSAKPVEDAKQFEIVLTGKNTSDVVKIKNAYAVNYEQEVAELVDEAFAENIETVKEQMDNIEASMQDELDAIEMYIEKNQSAPVLESQVASLSDQLNVLITEKNYADYNIDKFGKMLAELYAQADTADVDIQSEIDIAITSSGEVALGGSYAELSELEKAQMIVQIGDVEKEYLEAQAQVDALDAAMQNVEDMLEQTQSAYYESLFFYNKLIGEYDTTKEAYFNLQKELNMLEEQAFIRTQNPVVRVILTDTYAAPVQSVSMIKYLILGLIGGLAIGVVIVLLRTSYKEYKLKRSEGV